MRLIHTDQKTRGEIHFVQQEKSFNQRLRFPGTESPFLTIALNTGQDQQVLIDEVKYTFPAGNLLPLVSNQSFQFEKPEQITAWQYNRDFYCITDHDREISCVGFLFFGSSGNLFISLDEEQRNKLEILQKIFIEEFNTTDSIQTEMLQMLLKRLIIITTRLAKEQYIGNQLLSTDKYDLVRQFNFLVETHYKKEHQVQYYANLLNKSPKTLSNIFAQYKQKTPLLIIHERIIMEAKRFFFYTDRSAKEIAYELGFEDAAHFSRFFKNLTKQNPSAVRNTVQMQASA